MAYIIKLKGGLGNQLFQYAAAKAISVQHNIPLLLDVSSYQKKQSYRQPDILSYNLPEAIATTAQINKHVRNNWLYNRKPQWLQPLLYNTYQEKSFAYNPAVCNLLAPHLLDGYFQSEYYFMQHKKYLQQTFGVAPLLPIPLQNLLLQIQNNNSIAIHIRRTDYLLAQFASVHGALPATYYQRAIQHITNTVTSPTFFVFSDDINWAKQHLNLPSNTVFASEITSTVAEDFYLLQQCKHNIIANSSFSWWAAWLNTSDNKMVIAPHTWFTTNHINSADLIPKKWLQL